MKAKYWVLFGLIIVGLVAAIVLIQRRQNDPAVQTGRPANEAITQTQPSSTTPAASNQSHHVPAHYEVPPGLAELRPVLAPSQFVGKTREAYEAVRQIPATIAQMPCYCHCDRGMGHKSLHSCFEDDHAAHCATCIDEALMAYRLEKEGLSASQIRERIIARFSEPGL